MMRVLIVEDETILRQGIISLINWEALECQVVGECTNGNDAVHFLSESQVDIVITDIKMPGMDGLQLSEHIKKHYPNVQIILLTAYSSFSYAQTAIKLGVHNYIVKTNFVKELPAAVEETVDYIKKYGQANSVQNRDHMKSLVFSGILDGSISSPSKVSYWLSQYNLALTDYYVVLSEMIQPNMLDGPAPNMNKNMEIFKNFHDLAFQKFHCFSVWLQGGFLLNIISFDSGTPAENLQSIVVICNDVLSTVKNFMPFKLNMSISQHHDDPHDLVSAYQEAHASLSRILNENTLNLYSGEEQESTNAELPNVYSAADMLLSFLLSKDINHLDQYLNELIAEYQNSVQSLDKLKIEILLLVSIFFRKLTDNDINLDNADHLEQECNQRILQCRSLNALLAVLRTLFRDVNQMEVNICANSNYLVQMVNSIIREQYQTSIKLEDMAQILHVNSSYLSRLYKKETGNSIITALNKYRIKKAKELLKNNEYRVSEVGMMVGIEDPAYFANVFTKYAGISPKSYKGEF